MALESNLQLYNLPIQGVNGQPKIFLDYLKNSQVIAHIKNTNSDIKDFLDISDAEIIGKEANLNEIISQIEKTLKNDMSLLKEAFIGIEDFDGVVQSFLKFVKDFFVSLFKSGEKIEIQPVFAFSMIGVLFFMFMFNSCSKSDLHSQNSDLPDSLQSDYKSVLDTYEFFDSLPSPSQTDQDKFFAQIDTTSQNLKNSNFYAQALELEYLKIELLQDKISKLDSNQADEISNLNNQLEQETTEFFNKIDSLLQVPFISDFQKGEILSFKAEKYKQKDQSQAVEIYKQSLPFYDAANRQDLKASNLDKIAKIYYDGGYGDIDTALKYFEEALIVYQDLGKDFYDKQSMTFQSVGKMYQEKQDFDNARNNYYEAVKLAKSLDQKIIGNVRLLGVAYTRLAIMLEEEADISNLSEEKDKNLDFSREYYDNVISVYSNYLKYQLDPIISKYLAETYNNLGDMERKYENYDDALDYMAKAIKEKQKLFNIDPTDDNIGISLGVSYQNYAKILFSLDQKNNNKNQEGLVKNYLEKAKGLSDNFQDDEQEELYLYLGKTFYYYGMDIDKQRTADDPMNEVFDQTLEYLVKGLDYAVENENFAVRKDILEEIKQIMLNEVNRGHEVKTELLVKYIEDLDKINDIIESMRKDKATTVESYARENQDLLQEKLRRNQSIYLLIAVIAVLFWGGGAAVLSYKKVKEINNKLKVINLKLQAKTEELQAKTEELEKEKAKVEEAHKHIQSSIEFAQYIQKSILPSDEDLMRLFGNYYSILYKPKDVVSGDFYYIKELPDNKIAFAIADSTGHGVPGGFISMIGHAFFEEILSGFDGLQPHEVLDKIDLKFRNLLKQDSNKNQSNKDGMDVVFCILDKNTNLLEYSGAKNPLRIYRNGEIIEYKGARKSIGGYSDLFKSKFDTKKLNLEPNDVIIAFSDGYTDQFGSYVSQNGKNQKYKTSKLSRKELKELIKSYFQKEFADINNLSSYLDDYIKEWIQNGQTEQIDDILVFALKIPDTSSEITSTLPAKISD